jgi:hypothetical protein
VPEVQENKEVDGDKEVGGDKEAGGKKGEDVSTDNNVVVEVKQVAHVFEEIVDAKHLKYMSKYGGVKEDKEAVEEFWGMGVENESYLEAGTRQGVSAFQALRPRRERYSVDYYKSFAPQPLEECLSTLRSLPHMTYPVWMNGHTLQKTDIHLRHRTLYDATETPNPEFGGESIHDVLMRECDVYRDMYDQSVVFDGDTIEFITQDYYCATVRGAVKELGDLKRRWIEAVGPRLSAWTGGSTWNFPQRNEGLVTFVTTNQKTLSLCNTQTLHLNLTLPSLLRKGGGGAHLVDKERFMKEHLDWVSWIQVIEPLVVAVYGTPDVFSLVSSAGYSIGSQRATRSRYISLQTYDVAAPMNGKLLLQPRPEDPLHWYNRITGDSPYLAHTEIGYDVNVNKFKNHGMEVRFLDWFPEAYLPAVLDLMVLLGAHARAMGCGSSYKKDAYHGVIVKCLRGGCTTRLTVEEQEMVWRDMGLREEERGERGETRERGERGESTPYQVLCDIARAMYHRYAASEVVQKMSPGMPEPRLVNYNEEVLSEMMKGLYGTSTLILRAEASVFEQRTPLAPEEVRSLTGSGTFRVLVEASPSRCFPEGAYREAGAEIIPAGSWVQYPHAVVVGLKGLARGERPLDSQMLFHFAHCFKQQEGWREVLEGLGRARFVDYEFMLDDEGKRTLSFCRQAGHIGAWYTLMAYYLPSGSGAVPSGSGAVPSGSCSGKGKEGFCEASAASLLEEAIPQRPLPRILLVGFGTVGKSAKTVFDRFGLPCVVKRSADRVTAEEILSYDIYVHAIRLHPTEPVAPFLTEADLDRAGQRRLAFIADLSCDLGHPWNPLPVYHRYGTREEAVQRIRDASFDVPASGTIQYTPPLDVLAVPYLPSFDPVRSSVEFSSELVWYLSEERWLRVYPERNGMTRAMSRALRMTESVRAGAGLRT